LPSISEYGAAPAHLIRHRIYELKYLAYQLAECRDTETSIAVLAT
jgi:hypothetical protein